jgi:hypothetical protein
VRLWGFRARDVGIKDGQGSWRLMPWSTRDPRTKIGENPYLPLDRCRRIVQGPCAGRTNLKSAIWMQLIHSPEAQTEGKREARGMRQQDHSEQQSSCAFSPPLSCQAQSILRQTIARHKALPHLTGGPEESMKSRGSQNPLAPKGDSRACFVMLDLARGVSPFSPLSRRNAGSPAE